MILSLLEFALRALLVAAVVWAGLRLLGVRDVLAQKAAWGLVLASAILMPVLLPLAARSKILPAGFTLALPAHPWRAATSAVTPAARADSAVEPAASPAFRSARAPRTEYAVSSAPAAAVSRSLEPAPPLTAGSSGILRTIQTAPPIDRYRAPESQPLLPSVAALAWGLYLSVCAALILRLAYGLLSALSLWLDAQPVAIGDAAGLRLRSSRAISSPVTIGAGVVLPANYDEWDAEKLRIVLAHERSHVRQGDFYLQLLAGVYAALFWFSPLGWWLKRKLSDLGEAISDRAGLQEAASRSAYAQILLEFAAAPRPTFIGVAMARSSSLADRIERLLNDANFSQSFSWSRRRAFIAALLVPAAFFAATALIRVQAAGENPAAVAQQPPTPAVAPSAPSAPVRPVVAVAPTSQALAAPEGTASIAPIAAVAPLQSDIAQAAPVAPPAVDAPPAAAPPPPPAEPANSDDEVTVGAGQTLTITNENTNKKGRRSYSMRSGTGDGFAFSFRSDDEDSYALVTGPVGHVRFSGDWVDGRRAELEKAAQSAHGKFLWFSHEGKSYVIDDPSTIDSIEAMYKPMDELGRKQEELGKQQEALGKQQEELGRKQEQASVPTPDVSKEMAELNAALAKLQGKKTITQDEIGDLQSKIGEIQSRIGDIQGRIGEEQGRLGEQQGKLGEQQGKLGEQQGRLGEEQGRIARAADLKVKVIITDSLKNGKARPVE